MKISKDIVIADLLEKDPETAEVLMDVGMHCFSCPASLGETLEEAAMVHGLDVEEVLQELNDFEEMKQERGF